MIEMRWREAEFDDKTAVKVLHEKGNGLSMMMVLQYREREDLTLRQLQAIGRERPLTFEEALVQPKWSEWIDVPIHEGE